MKKSLVFILAVLFFAINFTAKSQEKIFDLKDKYYHCGSLYLYFEFKYIGQGISGDQYRNFLIEPVSSTALVGVTQLGTNSYAFRLSDISNNFKVTFYDNYKIDSLTGNITYDEIQSFEVIKLDTLLKPTITQVGNKLVSNLEGPHRWYMGNYFYLNDRYGRYEETPNNEYMPKMQGTYHAVVINPEYECFSLYSNTFSYNLTTVEEDIKYSNSQKYNLNENTITFFEVDWVSEAVEINSVEIFNILGEKLELNLSNISKNNNSISLQFDNNFNSLNAGMYLIIMKDNNNTLHKFTFVK